jgi:hypothetical protein
MTFQERGASIQETSFNSKGGASISETSISFYKGGPIVSETSLPLHYGASISETLISLHNEEPVSQKCQFSSIKEESVFQEHLYLSTTGWSKKVEGSNRHGTN